MKILVLLSVLFCLSCATTSDQEIAGMNFKLRAFQEVYLDNGLQVLLIEDKRLPALNINLMLKKGATSDPVGKSGLSSITAHLLNKGTKTKSATKMAEELELDGTEFVSRVKLDYSMLQMSGLSFNYDKMVEQFRQILLEPSFRGSELKRAKLLYISHDQKKVDEPRGFASQAFKEYLYGEHPYARDENGTKRDLETITRRDVIRYYKNYYRPNNAILAVVGKLPHNALELIKAKFGVWNKKDLPKLQSPVRPVDKARQIRLVDKADLKQTEVRMGHIGIHRKHKDYLSLRLANIILGSGFASRLVDEIRDNRGLTYSIHSRFEPGIYQGPFVISTFTKHENVGDVLSNVIKIVDKFRANGVTEEELEVAKNTLIGNFPRSLETADNLAYNLLILRLYGISDSYLTSYYQNLARVNINQVNEAIKKHIRPEKFQIVLFSNSNKTMSQASDIGLVEKIKR